jgi:hypothetical protein
MSLLATEGVASPPHQCAAYDYSQRKEELNMELARVLRELLKRPRLLALGVLVAAAAAILSVYSFSGGKLKASSLQHSAASTQVLVDSHSSALGSDSQSFEPLAARAHVYASFMVSPAFLDVIGKQVGLSGAQLYAAGPVNQNEPRAVLEPTELKRNTQITGETTPYRLAFESEEGLPTITINSQAPTTSQAVALANAAAVGLQQYVAGVASSAGVPERSRIVIRQLGSATGSVVDGGISKSLALLVFIAVFALWCVLMLVTTRFREAWRASAVLPGGQDGQWSETAADRDESVVQVSEHAPTLYPRPGGPASARLVDQSPAHGDGYDRGAAAAPVRSLR